MVCTIKIPGPVRVTLLSAGLLLGVAAPAFAQDKPEEQVISEGKSDYNWHCSACHGDSGKGDGPMAKMLIKPPADLTAIAKAKGGAFPFWRIYRIIAGKSPVPGHETFQMPDFWKRFSGDEKEWGFLPPHVRILELTHYIESIQKK
jgi:mono/diheme cytochrome c family protein